MLWKHEIGSRFDPCGTPVIIYRRNMPAKQSVCVRLSLVIQLIVTDEDLNSIRYNLITFLFIIYLLKLS